jgi:hypothetical protein
MRHLHIVSTRHICPLYSACYRSAIALSKSVLDAKLFIVKKKKLRFFPHVILQIVLVDAADI